MPFPWNDEPCTREHRFPQGPNEDIAGCSCGMPTYSMRPAGETFGRHADDCSLPLRHEGYCAHGGSGHLMPDGEVLRG